MSIMSIGSGRRERGRRAVAADATARIEVLLKREAPALLAYFERRVRPREDAADLLSETMVVTWRRAASVPVDGREARMWLFGVARHVLSTHRRGQLRRDALAAELRSELVLRSGDHSADVGAGDPRVERLQELVAALPELDREILALVIWDELTPAEVAALLGMPAGTVRSRLSRARTSVRARFEQGDVDIDPRRSREDGTTASRLPSTE